MGENIAELRGDDGSGPDDFWRNVEGQMNSGGSVFILESRGARATHVRGMLGGTGVYGRWPLPGTGPETRTDRAMPRLVIEDDLRHLGRMGLPSDGVEWG